MSKNLGQRIGDFNTKIAGTFIPDTNIGKRVSSLYKVNDPRIKKYVLKSVYKNKKTRDEVMMYLCKK